MNDTVLSRYTVLGATVAEWLIALLVVTAAVLAVYLTRRFVIGRLLRLAERTKTAADDTLVQVFRRTTLFLNIFIATRILAGMVDLAARVEQLVVALGTLALFLQFGLWANAAIRAVAERVLRERGHAAPAPGEGSIRALAFGLRLLLWAALLLVALDTFDIDVTALIAGLGIGGIAVALAAQSILGDLFAALAIVLDKPFAVGDTIQVDEYIGTVQHLGVKTTRLRSLSGEEIVFPNANLLQSRIRNFRRLVERRVVLAIGIEYGTPRALVAQVPELLRAAAQARERVRFGRAHLDRLADSAISFELEYFVLSSDYTVHMDVKQAILFDILERFAANGIQLAYPSRTVYVRGELGARGEEQRQGGDGAKGAGEASRAG